MAVWDSATRAWWRRALSLTAIPLTLVCALIVLNEWVGYYPTLQRAWGDLTSGPLPDQIDTKDLAGLRNTHPDTGKVVRVDIPDSGSGFKHRREFVYLPPAWFTGNAAAEAPRGDDDRRRIQQPDATGYVLETRSK